MGRTAATRKRYDLRAHINNAVLNGSESSKCCFRSEPEPNNYSSNPLIRSTFQKVAALTVLTRFYKQCYAATENRAIKTAVPA